jgi:hypothetical protein
MASTGGIAGCVVPSGAMMIEMVAYTAVHTVDTATWRCVMCEHVTKIEEANLFAHMEQAHGLGKDKLRLDGDALFLYPQPGEQKTFN